MVETAIAIPLLLVLMVGIFEVGPRVRDLAGADQRRARRRAHVGDAEQHAANDDGADSPVHGRRPAHQIRDRRGRRQQGRVDRRERHPRQRVGS